jgi:hypothetical protein
MPGSSLAFFQEETIVYSKDVVTRLVVLVSILVNEIYFLRPPNPFFSYSVLDSVVPFHKFRGPNKFVLRALDPWPS